MVDALVSSGLRAVYCYSVPRHISSLNPLNLDDDYSFDTVEAWKILARGGPYGNDRVQIGFAVDNVYQPPDIMRKLYSELRGANAKVITSHAPAGLAFGNKPSVLQILDGYDLLGPDVLLSHANFPQNRDAELLVQHNAWISWTPSSELQFGYPPVALLPEFKARSSLGADCHSMGNGYMPGLMRLELQYARTERQEALRRQGKWSRHVGRTAAEIVNLGTIVGARAIGMEGEIGQIKVGAKADLVIFDTKSPPMAVAAVVLHSSERDDETVLEGGVIRKECLLLLHEIPLHVHCDGDFLTIRINSTTRYCFTGYCVCLELKMPITKE
jgi:hypothetical protein